MRTLAVSMCIFVLATTTRADTVVFSTDFESGLPSQMTAAGCTIVPVQGFSGLGAPGNQFGGSFLRYHVTNIVDTKLELTNLPSHDHLDVSFLLALIDSWDGTELFKVSIDGVEVFSQWFELAQSNTSSYVAPPGGLLSSGIERGFSLGSYYANDRAYDMSVEPAFSVPHTASSVTIVWWLGATTGGAAQNWQGETDESWAIDNLAVTVSTAVTAIGDTPAFPKSLTLLPNSPNPFGSSTEVRVGLPHEADVRLDVFDVAGRRVASRDAGRMNAGWVRIGFDGRDDRGRALASGVYFYRVTAGRETTTHRMVIGR